MDFVDTHSHIYLPQFDNDRDGCIARSEKAGVNKIVLPNIDSASIPAMMETAGSHPEMCFPLIGLHPTHVKSNFEEELAIIIETCEKHNFYGIGEIGIDLYRDKTYIEEQRYVFKKQVNIALEKDLPVVIHARESFDEILNCLKQINSQKFKGIFHAFAGDLDQANLVIEMGFYIGIGGVVTFKNSSLPIVVEQLDLNHVVLETDSPYLAPAPYRGKRNESSYIPVIAEKIAQLKQVRLERVAEETTNNACKVINI